MKAQITLTVAEGKRVIAESIINYPQVKRALKEGKIFLKGGTTVSVIAEILTGKPLRISGRITPSGTRGAKKLCSNAHNIVIDKGIRYDLDELDEKITSTIQSTDIVIVGANVLDIYGNAAIMAGRDLGGTYGRIFSRLMIEAGETIVAVGLEKLVPGRVQDIIHLTKRKGAELAMGACVGLMPVIGKVITEIEAIESMATVECTVIGKGGIKGAEGSTTLLIDGLEKEVEKVFKKIWKWKGSTTSGTEISLIECDTIGTGCAYHYGCIYSQKSSSIEMRKKLNLY